MSQQSSSRGSSGTRRATPTILVVEDDEPLRVALSDLLEEEGYHVLSARDGEQAIALMRDERPSLVLLDVRMPNVDGNEVRRRQLADPTIARIPVIGMTADVGACLDDAVPMFVKPFDTDHFMTVVAVLSRHSVSASSASDPTGGGLQGTS
jgi:CheY-like chemotaxis protein